MSAMARWLFPIAVTGLLAVALLAFPEAAGAGDEDDAEIERAGCINRHDVAAPGDSVYGGAAEPGPIINARTAPQEPALPTVTLVAEEAPAAGLPWAWFALVGMVGVVGVAGVAYAVRPALARR